MILTERAANTALSIQCCRTNIAEVHKKSERMKKKIH